MSWVGVTSLVVAVSRAMEPSERVAAVADLPLVVGLDQHGPGQAQQRLGVGEHADAAMSVIYEGRVSVKAWSAPGGWQASCGRGPGGGRVDQSSIRAGSPMVSCGWGGSIKPAAVAQQGHDTHRARPSQAAGYRALTG
jgi:hypothetical protein